MVNWNNVVKALKSLAYAHSRVKVAEAELLSSPANGIASVKQASKEHEKALKTMARRCDRCGVDADYVFVVCDCAHSNDEKVKALLLNANIIGPIIESCNTNDTNDTNDNKEE